MSGKNEFLSDEIVTKEHNLDLCWFKIDSYKDSK